MSGQRLADYLDHMLEAVRLACGYVEGMDRADFHADVRTQQAVILNIVVIGEAATRVLQEYAEFAQEHPEVPWKNMRGMRNRIAHGYFSVDLDIVWDTVSGALPPLAETLDELRRSLPEG